VEEGDKADIKEEARRDGLLDIVGRCGIANVGRSAGGKTKSTQSIPYELSGLCGTLAWAHNHLGWNVVIAPRAELDRNKGIAPSRRVYAHFHYVRPWFRSTIER